MIWQQFAEQAEAVSGRDAVVAGDRRLSYAGLAALAAASAATLPAPAIRPGRVLVRQKDPLAILVSVLACWHRGLVPVVLRRPSVGTLRGWRRSNGYLAATNTLRIR